MTSLTEEKQEFGFQAEIKQLLHLLAHSLYQSRDIALRELLSNASDALDKMRFLNLTASASDNAPLEIVISPNETEKTLTIADNGIGMTRDELVKNLGTIAHSGSLAFLNNLTGDAKKDLHLIGQFGVGFYSAFMLADRVVVQSRSHQSEEGWQWESTGSGTFSVSPAEGLSRGTRIILHLREDASEFTKDYKIRDVVRRYSSFVPHPIKLETETLNNAKPIWVEPKSKVTQEEYEGFYQHLTHRGEEKPLWHLHVAGDSPIQFRAVLFSPATNTELLGLGRVEHGLYLCAKRILVQNDCRDLLPEYLRFVVGLVDSEDLPLNVSRESLQDNSVFRKIRSLLTKKVLEKLEQISENAKEEYQTFYQQFGPILREGLHQDYEHRERIAGLLRFRSTLNNGGQNDVSLEQYLSRANSEQKNIYYVGGPDLASVRNNPNLEVFKRRSLEVLLLTDPIDEYLLASLGTYKEKKLISVDSADLELPAEKEEDKPKSKPPVGGFAKVIELFKKALEEQVEDVRESSRLTDSPCCLVSADGNFSPQMEKLMKLTQREYKAPKRILEVNPHSPLVTRLCELSGNPQHDDFIRDCGKQLYDHALLLEGLAVDPNSLIARVQQFMQENAQKRSSIILS